MALRGVIGFLLVLAIAFTFSSYMFYNLTIHDTGQQFFGKMLGDKIEQESSGEKLNQTEREVRFDCKEKGKATVEATKETLDIDCSKMDRIPFKILLANSIYDNIYYRKYDCKVFDCLGSTEKISGLIAQQNHMRYLVYYWYLLAIDIILAVLLFFVSPSWLKKASAFGYVLLISGLGALPFFVTQRIFSAGMAFMNNILYAQIIMFAVGVVLLVIAMIMKSRHRGSHEYKEPEEDEYDKDNS